MNFRIITLVYMLVIAQLLSADVVGVGVAKTNSEAKKEALADLSQNIKSEVRSSFESSSTNSESNATSNIKVSSSLPILGAEFDWIKKSLDIEMTASLSPQKVSKLYINKLNNLNSEIKKIENGVQKAKTSLEKLKLYESLYSLLNEYDRYESVAVILDATLPFRPKISKSEVKVYISNLNSNIDTINMACRVFAETFNSDDIYIYAPQLDNYTTISEFASVFAKELKGVLKTVKSPTDAKFILVGSYSLTKNSMVLNYELLNAQTNEVEKSKTVNIQKSAYKDLETKPKNIDFDALLNSGLISSSDLKVSLKSNRGTDNLLFKSGNEVELFIKLNKMGYLYIVGYTQAGDSKFSYLLELNEGHGDTKFMKFVNADDANRWMSLGSFIVEEPFGVESLQIIASNQKITSLPKVKYDENSEYYVISTNLTEALTETRGLKKKRSKKVEMSEDVLSFTTMQK